MTGRASREHRDSYLRAIAAAQHRKTLTEIQNHAFSDSTMTSDDWLDVNIALKERLDEMSGGAGE